MKKIRESHLKIVLLLVVVRRRRRSSWSSKIFVHSRRPNFRARSYARPSAASLRSEQNYFFVAFIILSKSRDLIKWSRDDLTCFAIVWKQFWGEYKKSEICKLILKPVCESLRSLPHFFNPPWFEDEDLRR